MHLSAEQQQTCYGMRDEQLSVVSSRFSEKAKGLRLAALYENWELRTENYPRFSAFLNDPFSFSIFFCSSVMA